MTTKKTSKAGSTKPQAVKAVPKEQEVQETQAPNLYVAIVMEPSAPMEVLPIKSEQAPEIMAMYKQTGELRMVKNKGRTMEIHTPYAMLVLVQADAFIYEAPKDAAIVPSEAPKGEEVPDGTTEG